MKTKMFQYPIIVLNGEEALPETGSYYVVADNGIFFHKNDGILSTDAKVESISDLDSYHPQVLPKFAFSKISAQLVNEIKLFFSNVVKEYRSESCVILFYNAKEQHWVFKVPEQRVSHGGVVYDRKAATTELPIGYVPVGTIHSHCDFGAFHSGTDIGDEEYWDGLHVTFGHNDCDQFTITACIVNRTKIEPMDVLEGVRVVDKVLGKECRYELEVKVFDQETIDNVNSWINDLVERM